jgi:SsrA-binding protein
MHPGSQKLISTNRKARHFYDVVDTYEAGIALRGSEVKSLRMGHASLVDSYASVERGEVILHNLHISPYEKASAFSPEPRRARKLLLHKQEIRKLIGSVTQKGMTLVPLKLYFSEKGIAKVQLALARGKKKFDRREAIKLRDMKRDIEREMKER